ncbi:putative ankyrin repeat protein like [Verticillium longisporum]|nr:putative ankyrin repeat protein like [Verticillium longisporum]
MDGVVGISHHHSQRTSFTFGDYIAMDPLSIAASVTGVLAFAASTARGLHSLVMEIRDAPEDISAVGRDVQSLVAVLASAQETCTKLNEGKASLNLKLSALNGLLEGKGQDDIRADIKDAYVKIMNEFRNFEAGKRVKRRIEDDVASASTERGRRASLSEVTDPEFSMRRFLQPAKDDRLVAGGINATMSESHNTANTAALLSPWASDPNAILEAVRARNQHLIETLLNQGISLSTRSVQGYTVLHYCAIADDSETANLLIEHGADINAKDYELRSPLRLALASEALSVARILSEKGCVIGDSSTALLRLTGRSEEVPGVRPLLQSLAKRLVETGQGPFLLHQAISEVDKFSIKILLDEGFSISKPDHRARGLHSLLMEIRDAPEDISAVGRDVQSLVAVLASAQETCTKYDICREDKALAVALGDYLDMCQEAMQGMHILLKPLASTGGGGKRSPLRFALGWTMRKSEIRGLRARLNEGKASLNLTLSALNGLLEGKGQDDIRADIKDAYVKIMNEFRNFEAGKRVKRRIEDDVASASTERGRRASLSEVTDPEFSMRRFLQPVTDDRLVAGGINATMGENHNTAATAALLSPWASDPNAILEAVRARNQHLIETLLNQGISLSTRSVQGYTVLHYCAIADDSETAKLLIEHGADINAKDYELRSPFRLALASEALSVARLLSFSTRGSASASLIIAESHPFITPSDAIADLRCASL